MKLKDFADFQPFNKLRKSLNNTEYKSFDYKAKKIIDKNEYLNRALSNTGIEVDISEISTGKNATLNYADKPVLLYMKDWYFDPAVGVKPYKFHIANCKTIREFSRKQQSDKYTVSQRTDGFFYVNLIEEDTEKVVETNSLKKMQVCKNCLMELEYNGYQNHWKDKDIYEEFDIAEFFEEYGRDEELLDIPIASQASISADYAEEALFEAEEYHKEIKTEKIDNEYIIKVRDLAVKILEQREKINELALEHQSRVQFLNTSRGFEIMGMLPSFFIREKEDFKNWVNMMYQLLYEASGGKNADYPIASFEERVCKVRYDINKLRNFYYHDPDTAGYPEREKGRVKNIFVDYLKRSEPENMLEYREVQVEKRSSSWTDKK